MIIDQVNRAALSREANSLLYLQCYQFVLHEQVKSLLRLGLPTELEVGLSLSSSFNVRGLLWIYGVYISRHSISKSKERTRQNVLDPPKMTTQSTQGCFRIVLQKNYPVMKMI